MSKSTPWGPARSYEKLANGIISYETFSGGGIHLSPTRVQSLPGPIKDAAKHLVRKSGDAWFEHGSSACLVHLAYPEFFGDACIEIAKAIMANFYPDEFTRLTGKPVTLDQSEVLVERVFRERAQHCPVACRIWTGPATNVPPGKVGIFARVGGFRSSDLAGSNWLVSESEYAAYMKGPMGKYPFLVDPNNHQKVTGEFVHVGPKTTTVKKMLEAIAH